jgi:hypothetical protein
VELWLLLGALWLVECLTFFPPGAASFQWPAREEPRVQPRAGLALVLPWPGRFAAVLDGIPFELTRGFVSARGALSLLSATAGMDEERVLPLGALAPEAVGARVRTRAGPLLRASSDVAAERCAGWLRELEQTPEAERAAAFHERWRRALDPAQVRASVERVRSYSRPHRGIASLSLACVVLAIPALAFGTGAGFDAAWDVAWPALLALHLAGWLALLVAERRLRAPGAGLRLFRTLLYPPSLWRASFDQASAALGRHHSLAVAAALIGPDANEPLARRALAECTWPVFDRRGPATGPDLAERRAAASERCVLLQQLFAGAGLSAERLAAPPQPRTPHAASYCPVCQSEFVVGGWSCPDCRVEAKAF